MKKFKAIIATATMMAMPLIMAADSFSVQSWGIFHQAPRPE